MSSIKFSKNSKNNVIKKLPVKDITLNCNNDKINLEKSINCIHDKDNLETLDTICSTVEDSECESIKKKIKVLSTTTMHKKESFNVNSKIPCADFTKKYSDSSQFMKNNEKNIFSTVFEKKNKEITNVCFDNKKINLNDDSAKNNKRKPLSKSNKSKIIIKKCRKANNYRTKGKSLVCTHQNKAADDGTSEATSFITKKWKLVPISIYNHFSELYKNNKIVHKKRKRKNHKWNENKYKKNLNKSKLNENFCDPYVECINKLDDDSPANIKENICMILHVGVNRPLFPLVYRNIVTLNDKKDTEITDLWAEFSLSTLIIQPSDIKPKPVFVPVKDTKLMSAILDYKAKVPFQFKEITCEQTEKREKSNVQQKINSFSPVKYRKNVTVIKSKKNKMRDDADVVRKLKLNNVNKNQEKSEDKIETKKFSNEFCDRLNFNNNEFKQCFVLLPKLNVPFKNENHDQLDVNNILKNKEYNNKKLNIVNKRIKNDIISDEKQNVTNNRVSYVNLIDNDEEKIHFFGTKHCTRTFGSMMDFTVRNRSLVYFYKMRQILRFQKQNNKLFQLCFYVRIQYNTFEEENTFVDILSETSDKDCHVNILKNEQVLNNQVSQMNHEEDFKVLSNLKELVVKAEEKYLKTNNKIILKKPDTTKQISTYSTCNPLNILKFPELSIHEELMLKDLEKNTNKFSIHFVDSSILQKKKNVKWLILGLNKSLVTVIYKNKHFLPFQLLFQIIYRADLTKKVVCCTFESGRNDNKLTFGVYGVPGLCEAILFGPYEKREKHHELSALVRVADNIIYASTLNFTSDDEFFLQISKSKHTDICLFWWKPSTNPLSITYVNTSLLNFFFVPNEVELPSVVNDEINISEIFLQHNCVDYLKYEISENEKNYVFFHNSSNFIFQSENIFEDNQYHRNYNVNGSLSLEKLNNKNTRFKYRKKNKRLSKFDETYSDSVSSKFLICQKNFGNVASSKEKLNSIGKVKNEKLLKDEFARYRELLRLSVKQSEYTKQANSMSLIEILHEKIEVINTLKKNEKLLINEKRKLKILQNTLLHTFTAQLKRFDPNDEKCKKGKMILSQLFQPQNAKNFEKKIKEFIKTSDCNDNFSSTKSLYLNIDKRKKNIETYAAESYFDNEKLIVKSRIFKKKCNTIKNHTYGVSDIPDISSLKRKKRRRRGQRFYKKKIKNIPANKTEKCSIKSRKISTNNYRASTTGTFKIDTRYSPSNEGLFLSEHSYCSRDNSNSSMNDSVFYNCNKFQRYSHSSLILKRPNERMCIINSVKPQWKSLVSVDSDNEKQKILSRENTINSSQRNEEEILFQSSNCSTLLPNEDSSKFSDCEKFSLHLTENNKPITKVVIEKLKNENRNTINLPISDRRKRIINVIHTILQEIVQRASNKSLNVGNEERVLIPRLQLLQRMLQGAENKNFNKTKTFDNLIQISDDENDIDINKSIVRNIFNNSNKGIESIDDISILSDITVEGETSLKNFNVNQRKGFHKERVYDFCGDIDDKEVLHSTNDSTIDNSATIEEQFIDSNVVINENTEDSNNILNSCVLNNTSKNGVNVEEVVNERIQESEDVSSVNINANYSNIINSINRYNKRLINTNYENVTNNTGSYNINNVNYIEDYEFEKNIISLVPLSNIQNSVQITQKPKIGVNNTYEGIKYKPNILKIFKKDSPYVNNKKNIVVVSINGKPTHLTIKSITQQNGLARRLRCPSFVPVSSESIMNESCLNECDIDSNKIISPKFTDSDNMEKFSSTSVCYNNVERKTSNERTSFSNEEVQSSSRWSEKQAFSKEENTLEKSDTVITSRLGVKSFASINSCFYDVDRLLNY